MIPTRHCSCTKADPFFFTRLDSDLEHRSTFAVVYAELNFSNTSWNPASGCWTDYGLFLSRHWFTHSSSGINQLSTRFHLDFYLHYDRRLVPWTLKQQRRYRSYHYYLLLSCWHGTGFPWRSVFSQGTLLSPLSVAQDSALSPRLGLERFWVGIFKGRYINLGWLIDWLIGLHLVVVA